MRLLFTYVYLFIFQLNIGNTQLNNINSLGTYRQSTNRPSPQSSPGLTIQVCIFI